MRSSSGDDAQATTTTEALRLFMSLRDLTLAPRLHLRRLLVRVRTSIWLVPTFGAVVAVLLGVGLIELDRHIEDTGYMFDGGPESARELLSTAASSMLTFTALVFSITILVLQLASNQFSPRVIRTFLEERVTKIAMATFVGTFLYTVVVLSQVRVAPEFVPGIATWTALVLVLASVAVFIRYIHRMTHSIRAISVITTIASESRRTIERMFPGDVATGTTGPALPERAPDHVLTNDDAPGVVTFVDAKQLVEIARRCDAVMQLVPKLGDFVPSGAAVLRVWGAAPDRARCHAAVAFDQERTMEQDPAFGLRQLVDIAMRALSPGINDPTTAVQVIDHLHDLLRRLTRCRFPSSVRADPDGTPRLVIAQLDYRGYVRLALDELIRFGATSPQVNERLERLLEDCRQLATADQVDVLEDYTRKLREAATGVS